MRAVDPVPEVPVPGAGVEAAEQQRTVERDARRLLAGDIPPGAAAECTDPSPGHTAGPALAAVCWPEPVAALDRGQLAGTVTGSLG